MRVTLIVLLCTLFVSGSVSGQDWSIEGKALTIDNCDVGCPCIFGEEPTHGRCEYLGVMIIESGKYGNVVLDNTRIALAGAFGRPKEREAQQYDFVAFYVDTGLDAGQKTALKQLLSSEPFKLFGNPVEVKEVPIIVKDLSGFGEVDKTCTVTVGDIGKIQVTPISGAMAGKPIVVENSAEILWNWTVLGKASESFYKAAGVNWTFNSTSGESHRFSLKSTSAMGASGHHKENKE
jgi:hypothetical protein